MTIRKSKGGTDTCQAALEGIGIFSELTRAQQKSLARLMTCVPVKAGRTLTTEGQSGREFMIIVDGQASSSSTTVPRTIATAASSPPSVPAISSAR